MKKCLFVLAAALACVAVAAPDQAKSARPERPMGMHGRPGFMPGGGMMGMDPVMRAVMNPRTIEKLDLTPEQRTKIEEITKNPAGSDTQKKIRAAMGRQMELLKATPIDENAVMAAIDEVFELRKQSAKEQTKRLIAVRSILTPEQVEKAVTELRSHRRMPRGEKAGGPRRPMPKGENPAADAPKPAADAAK